MSNTLNPEELAAKRYPKPQKVTPRTATLLSLHQGKILGYSDAIREVAQPIEDQRAELLEWLVELVAQVSTLSADAKAQISPATVGQCRAAINKATKPIYNDPQP